MPSDNPYRRFYEDGGYTGRGRRRSRLNLALWGSQFFADGGRVMPPLNLAYGSQYYDQGGQVLDDVVASIMTLRQMMGNR